MNTQMHENLYIYEVFELVERRWVSIPVLAIDVSVADMIVWRRFRSEYRLVKTVLWGCRRSKGRGLVHTKQVA